MKKLVGKYFWIKQEDEGYRIGLTNRGQDDLGTISFLSLPRVGEDLEVNESFADVESDKTVTELLTPLAGTVAAINEEALDDPTVANAKNEDFAWLMVLNGVDKKDFETL